MGDLKETKLIVELLEGKKRWDVRIEVIGFCNDMAITRIKGE
jgi:hypothetical protein